MAVGFHGYDAARVAVLGRRMVEVSDELLELADNAPPSSDVGGMLRSIAAGLRWEWVPVIGRLGADTTLTSWLGHGIPTGVGDLIPRPPHGEADEVARWWNDLIESQRAAVLDVAPSTIGNLDGVPAWARDHANRQRLAMDLERLESSAANDSLSDAEAAALANARAVRKTLADGARFVDPRTGERAVVQLYLYEPGAHGGDGRVAIAVGDLDTARHLAVAVPGMGTEASMIGMQVPTVVFAAASAHTSDGIAVMTWHGYDAPSIAVMDGSDDDPLDAAADWIDESTDLVRVVTLERATAGAAELAADVAGVRAMRGADDIHMTVIGNSYGSTTVAIAADEFGLAADDIALTGSPGAGRANDAGDLTTGASNTWVGSASDDPVSYLGRSGGAEPHDVVDGAFVGSAIGLGHDPAEDDFGARRFQAEWPGRDDDFPWQLAGHRHYFDPCGEAADNLGAIVAGAYGAVELAEPRHKDESWDLWDPLGDLLPADPEANEPVEGGSCS